MASEAKEGANIKVFVSEDQRSSVVERASVGGGACSIEVFPLQVSPEIEDERRYFPKMSRAIPVVLEYIILILGLNLNLCNLSMRCM